MLKSIIFLIPKRYLLAFTHHCPHTPPTPKRKSKTKEQRARRQIRKPVSTKSPGYIFMRAKQSLKLHMYPPNHSLFRPKLEHSNLLDWGL